MPAYKCSNGKYRWGSKGKPIYNSAREAEKAWMHILTERINKAKDYLNSIAERSSEK